VSAIRPGPTAHAAAIPQLAFAVDGAEPVRHAAAPTLAFALRIDRVGGPPVRAILLDVQIQIAARRRRYDAAAQERLFDLFGAPEGWSSALRTLLWTRATVIVPPFDESAAVELAVPCTYDLEVAASRYFDSLTDGEVPLELLFSGSVFYAAPDGRLQTTRISWEHEAEYRMPVRVWRETIDQHFPGGAWLRLSRDRFDRLSAFKASRALATWDDAVDALLPEGSDPFSHPAARGQTP
jgi:Family of unknown function (DUF6084)